MSTEVDNRAPAAHAIPLGAMVPAVGAPLAVVASLASTGSVLVAFVTYHVLLCIVLPASHTAMTGPRSWRALAESFGAHTSGGRLALTLGAGLGVGTFVAIVGGMAAMAPFVDVDVHAATVGTHLSAWGVPASAAFAVFLYMLVGNSVAEELFWRGWLHSRLPVGRTSRRNAIFLATLLFASYHYYTISSLLGDPVAAGPLTAGVFIGGLTWAALREWSGSVWPAVLAHVGATAGYMTVYLVWVV